MVVVVAVVAITVVEVIVEVLPVYVVVVVVHKLSLQGHPPLDAIILPFAANPVNASVPTVNVGPRHSRSTVEPGVFAFLNA